MLVANEIESEVNYNSVSTTFVAHCFHESITCHLDIFFTSCWGGVPVLRFLQKLWVSHFWVGYVCLQSQFFSLSCFVVSIFCNGKKVSKYRFNKWCLNVLEPERSKHFEVSVLQLKKSKCLRFAKRHASPTFLQSLTITVQVLTTMILCMVVFNTLESTSENTEAEYCDIPPLLPAKKGSTVHDESSDSPPPLPAKKGAMASTTFVDDFPLAGGMS